MSKGYCYLACPYTHFNPLLVELRVAAASQCAAWHLENGVNMVSPITHGHAIEEEVGQLSYDQWLESYSVGQLWTKNVIQGGATHE